MLNGLPDRFMAGSKKHNAANTLTPFCGGFPVFPATMKREDTDKSHETGPFLLPALKPPTGRLRHTGSRASCRCQADAMMKKRIHPVEWK